MMYKVYKLPDLHAQPADGGAMNRYNQQTAGTTRGVYKGPM